MRQQGAAQAVGCHVFGGVLLTRRGHSCARAGTGGADTDTERARDSQALRSLGGGS
jgi:hypothetical protein